MTGHEREDSTSFCIEGVLSIPVGDAWDERVAWRLDKVVSATDPRPLSEQKAWMWEKFFRQFPASP